MNDGECVLYRELSNGIEVSTPEPVTVSPIEAVKLKQWVDDLRHQAMTVSQVSSQTELALIDVSEEGEYGLGHLLWAVNIPYSILELQIRLFVPRANCVVVLIDHGNGVAKRAAKRLQVLGYPHLYILTGGVESWETAGYELFQGVYVPSKAFGEWVEHHFATPSTTPAELVALRQQGQAVVVLDPRTRMEHAVRHVPGAISCPGEELVQRFHDLVPNQDCHVVISCGGRTRGIVGAQTLINAGVANKVTVLDGGVHGWQLAGYELENGSQIAPLAVSKDSVQNARHLMEKQMRDVAIARVAPVTVKAWLDDVTRSTYIFDIRSTAEYARGHFQGARSAPGGQLLQATDRWMATMGARVVLVDTDGIRASQIANWLKMMGWDVWLMPDATIEQYQNAIQGESTQDIHGELNNADAAAQVKAEMQDVIGQTSEVNAAEAALLIQEKKARFWSVDRSADFLRAHPTGARWVNRARLETLREDVQSGHDVLLFSEDVRLARLAAIDVAEMICANSALSHVYVVKGGLQGWLSAGQTVCYSAEEDTNSLKPEQRIDMLYWGHERRRGNAEAMRAYLNWEKQLLAQLASDGTTFKH